MALTSDNILLKVCYHHKGNMCDGHIKSVFYSSGAVESFF